MLTINYENKYNKYKKKYLNLKNIINNIGGATTNDNKKAKEPPISYWQIETRQQIIKGYDGKDTYIYIYYFSPYIVFCLNSCYKLLFEKKYNINLSVYKYKLHREVNIITKLQFYDTLDTYNTYETYDIIHSNINMDIQILKFISRNNKIIIYLITNYDNFNILNKNDNDTIESFINKNNIDSPLISYNFDYTYNYVSHKSNGYLYKNIKNKDRCEYATAYEYYMSIIPDYMKK